MREKKPYMVISFQTTTDAMAMEEKCGQAGIPGRLIPVPKEITAGCGLAWRIGQEEYTQYQDQMEALGLRFDQVTPLVL